MTGEKARTFFCPHCGEKLSFLDGAIIRMDGVLACDTFSVRAQFFFPAALGQYGVVVAGDVQVEEGARVEFHCPNRLCNKNFTSPYNHDLAEVRMEDEDGRAFVVVFHKTHGRQATFLIDPQDRTVLGSFGAHAETYAETFQRPLNFFGAV